jgi:dipeptidyl aminopeptidase
MARDLVLAGGVLAFLIWGSTLLVQEISHLQSVTLQLKQTELLHRFVKEGYHGDDGDSFVPGNRIGFAESRNKSFTPSFKPIQWISDPQSFTNDQGLYSTHDGGAYFIKSILDSDYSQLLYNDSHVSHDGREYKIDKFVSSPDLKHALIQTNSTQHWRHSTFGLYWLLDIESQSLRKIYPEKLSVAQWSPTSDNIALVFENNVYIYHLASDSVEQVSYDGSADIFNGKPDWVYEEEVFEGDSALWWSPNGEYLTYLKANDSLVPEFPIPYFVQDSDEFKNSSYPELRKIKYPKPGYWNPDVSLGLYSLVKKENEVIDYTYDIFTEVIWVGNDQLLLKATNRASDYLKVVLINALDFSYEIIRDEVTDSWFEITHDTFYIPKSDTIDRDGYIDTIPVNGFNHLAYFSPPSNSTPQILTEGDFEVVSAPSAFDYSKNLIYYVSTKDSSIERHLYSLDLLTGEHSKITHGEGWFSASFSAGARFVSLSYRGPDIPSQSLVDLSNNESQVLESNNELYELLQHYDLPEKIYGEVEISENVTVNFVEIRPPHFDADKEYPVLFFVYGGPGSQLVQKTFQLSFPDVVSSQLDAIIVTVDGRGTGFKGREFRSLVRDNLGYYEVTDQIAAAKLWASKPYVDASKVAIFGWSYGGFMTLKTLEADAGETFKYGMSVAPVTDWRLYDSIYTERYMHLPEDNAEGYDTGAVHNVTQIGKATRFLLMHGTGDDNVHIQNTFKVLDKFDLAGVENYDLHVFPDSDHSIRYHNANVIVYNKLLKWLEKAFRGDYVYY